MKEQLIREIRTQMSQFLSETQMDKLHEVLLDCFSNIIIEITDEEQYRKNNNDYLRMYIAAKEIEGCSEKTIHYYRSTIHKLLVSMDKDIKKITTEDLRLYLAMHQKEHNASKVTMDNIRRILSGFFSWLEDEDYIIKSPARRIHKVKTEQIIKDTFSDENLEVLRNACPALRDLVLIEFLSSTGVRVGELVKLNRQNINFQERSCIVFGKGSKEREVYFDARTKLHLQEYLDSRTDNNEALFVSIRSPYERLSISGVEKRLKKLGSLTHVDHVYPHKFRRTLATMAIDKGMPIEQVQMLLGHVRIDTTMHYAMVNQNNVKNSHRKYIG
ncbi:MAG: tyrosine-type recombinase/integrase [Lachnospiraceae bacterium]|nr:tyrosine-type recombinase/integrase [Lachnospiraceae bacterium]